MMKRYFPTTALVLAMVAVSVSCDKIKPPQPELTPGAPASVASSAEQAQSKTFMQTDQKPETALSEAQQHLEKLKAATLESWSQMKETFKTSLDTLKGAVMNAIEASS